MKNCVFTICAKNYLAQALTLQESLLMNNPSLDFYIFLSDLCDVELIKNIPNIVMLDDKIIPRWEEMAFKYNVIEFSTSIKPFCINYLFKSYERIIYLDPDVYITASLDTIFTWLEDKDIILTPHYNHVAVEYNGAVSEEELLFVGIYNLGFFAIKNSEKGILVINWWMNRLVNKCFADKHDALHVDQRWIDFLPGFFPDDILISHHQGCNVAIWNLHERVLIKEIEGYLIKDIITNDIKPLLFFHFSGFDPYNKNIINRRHPIYNVDTYPSFKQLIDDYVEKIYTNNYAFFSRQKYSFDYFTNNKKILPIHRRIYKSLLLYENIKMPFSSNGLLYKNFEKRRLISKTNDIQKIVNEDYKSRRFNILKYFFKFAFCILGVNKYSMLLKALQKITRLDEQFFLYYDEVN